MLIEGGYLHSLKTLLEKADDIPASSTSGGRPPNHDDDDDREKARGFGASLRRLRARLLRRSIN